jgi:hypothetical protein
VKVCDLLEVHENQFFVVANDPWHQKFLLGRVDGFDVAIDHSLQILAELLFRFNQLTDDSSAKSKKLVRIEVSPISLKPYSLL